MVVTTAMVGSSFRNEPSSRAYLEWLLNAFREYPLAVELRHREWTGDDLPALADLGYNAFLWRSDSPSWGSLQGVDFAKSGIPTEPAPSATPSTRASSSPRSAKGH